MKATRDLIIGAFATALLGFAFARIELVEALLGMGRYYQKTEFGPALAAVPALALVVLWFAGQRWREASRLTRELKRTQGRLRQAREKGRSLEDQLGGTSRMAAMGALTGGLAHEFNNVLQPIITLAQLNLDQNDSPEERRMRVRHILKAAEHGTEIVRGTLAFPAGGTLETEELTAARELEEIADQARETYRGRLQVEVRIAEEAGTIRVNPSEFRQVVTNLLKNAAEAMREGAVVIGLDAVDLDARGAGSRGLTAGPYLRVTVTDDGPGMAPDAVAKVFEPFYTTKEAGKGTGLGLAVVDSLVRGWNGRISVQSSPGEGASFEILIPRSEGED